MDDQDVQPESPWKFDIGQAVTMADVPGEVVWRRENQASARDYLVRTAAGESWVAEAAIEQG